MPKAKPRPVYLNLLRIRLPIPGVASILHRASGLLMFALIPVALYLLDRSLRSADDFAAVTALLHSSRWLLLPLVWALSHHLLAGLRVLLIDLEWGLERDAMRRSAWFVTLAAAAITVVVAIGMVMG
jgi:succinate dehydrogenase / fumarate reductase cytochrome b subunit